MATHFAMDVGSGHTATTKACPAAADVYCDRCQAVNVDVLSADTADGEYGCIELCRSCIDELFAGLRR